MVGAGRGNGQGRMERRTDPYCGAFGSGFSPAGGGDSCCDSGARPRRWARCRTAAAQRSLQNRFARQAAKDAPQFGQVSVLVKGAVGIRASAH